MHYTMCVCGKKKCCQVLYIWLVVGHKLEPQMQHWLWNATYMTVDGHEDCQQHLLLSVSQFANKNVEENYALRHKLTKNVRYRCCLFSNLCWRLFLWQQFCALKEFALSMANLGSFRLTLNFCKDFLRQALRRNVEAKKSSQRFVSPWQSFAFLWGNFFFVYALLWFLSAASKDIFFAKFLMRGVC